MLDNVSWVRTCMANPITNTYGYVPAAATMTEIRLRSDADARAWATRSHRTPMRHKYVFPRNRDRGLSAHGHISVGLMTLVFHLPILVFESPHFELNFQVWNAMDAITVQI